MDHYPLTLKQKEKNKKNEERRRRERQRREDEYCRRIERLRRQIEEARKRRQRMLLLFLLAVLAMQESLFAAFTRSVSYRSDPIADPTDWTPDPNKDFAPAPGHGDHCDGYSYERWNRMLKERGICVSRKAELQEAWKSDPDREFFPTRYQLWGYRPFVGEVMSDLTDQRWQGDALKALKLMSPPETHRYLDEAYASDPADLLMCRANSSADIVRNFQSAAVRWEFRKQREAEEARREKELSRKNDGEQGIPEPN
ncbi:MAG: hypothetical protein M9955_26425 [Rhizobiaceae bacterium]|uniref:hypothetical protein n=1 Tax=unclassified Shinella TaxID=2643062 RepID=UPI00225D0512|nr:hypothetical protein [Shinella sp. YE25]MCO5085184.1 hypothetical protein [Rhizobiaceae bacterium]MDC7255741.1 hypothetical protein [Shinella sp. YE25]CAI0338560.1 conserved hypothetical protein [Rhizobiaceae bacterium]CAK7257002.1 conserved protein of unknown function [Shinella sp. WSC3-e]